MIRRRIRFGWVLHVALAACAAPGEQPGDLPVLRLHRRPLIASPITLQHVISPENDGWGFALPIDLAIAGGGLLVLEHRNSRIVVLDSAYRAVRTIGRPGAGPGELRGVSSLAVQGNEVAVSEITNSRISVFTSDGDFTRSVPVAYGASPFAFAPGGLLYVSAASAEHYLLATDRTGRQRPFGRRPSDRYPPELFARAGPFAWSTDHAVVATDSSVYVYDPYLSALLRFDRSGRQVDEIGFPAWLRKGLLAVRARALADFGGRGPVYRAPIGGLSRTDDGDLLVLFPTVAGVFGLLVDPVVWSATPLAWSADRPVAPRDAGGRRGVLRGRTLYRIQGDNIAAYQLVPGRSR